MNEEQDERQESKNERNIRNNENNILNAAEVAEASGNPIAMAIGRGVKIADKVSGGRATTAQAKMLNRANKIVPGGRKAQRGLNNLSESGISNKVGKAASKKNFASNLNNGNATANKESAASDEQKDSSTSATNSDNKKSGKTGLNFRRNNNNSGTASKVVKAIWKKLPLKAKLIIIGIGAALILTTIFIVVLISPLMSLGIIDISGMGGSSGLGYSTNTYLQKVNDECKSIIVDNQAYSLEDYVKGVVSAEAYTSEGIEALKAQAIAARTFAIKRTNNCTTSIENSSSAQNFTSDFVDSAVEATEATEGLVLTDNSELIMAQYDSFYTDGDYACDDDGCSVTYTKLPNNETHKVTVSNDYKSYIAGGHGRGMSQVASYQLAKEGYKFDYILKYFYSPSVQISSLRGYGGYTSGLSAGANGFTKRTGAPSSNNSHDVEFYYSDNNVSYKSNTDLVGQCTWYAVGRANEILSAVNSDLRLERAPHAKYWYQDNIDQKANAFSYSPNVNEPKVGAIIVWSSDEFGHVAVVEVVNDDGTIDYSEANISTVKNDSNPYGFRYQSNVSYTGTGEGTISNIWQGYSFVGYIYVIE